MKRVLLLEPNYKNKYPPMGLMKLAMYHRLQSPQWDVVFYKGDLREFVLNEYVDDVVKEFEKKYLQGSWRLVVPEIRAFLKTGVVEPDSSLEWICDKNFGSEAELFEIRKSYKRGDYFKEKRWDRVCVTTLFTFYWKITVETIEFAKKIVKDPTQILVGGVLASVVPDDLEAATGIKPHRGCIYDKKILDDKPLKRPFDVPIDELPLDYSILDEIDYRYPCSNAHYAYATRGCVNRCPFCAVPILEPEYKNRIPLTPRIEKTREYFGEQRDLLLLDNNVFASSEFPQIVEEIRRLGFGKGDKFTAPNPLEIVERQLVRRWNDRAYIRKGVALLNAYCERLRGEKQAQVAQTLTDYNLRSAHTATRDNLLKACRQLKKEYAKTLPQRPVVRRVDFNQGVDARLANEEKMKALGRLAIKPLRVAFDDWNSRKHYVQAIYYARKYGIAQASNYLLYNFRDEPVHLYRRLLLNVDLCDALDVNIYSFPMKYHPIFDKEWFTNRHYLGKHWSRKAIRAIQVVLNSTKGKVGRSRTFFYAAFGRDEAAFAELLQLPEAFILNRWDAEISGLTSAWREARAGLNDSEKQEVDKIVCANRFVEEDWRGLTKRAQKYLRFYLKDKTVIPDASNAEKTRFIEDFQNACSTEISPVCRQLLDEIAR